LRLRGATALEEGGFSVSELTIRRYTDADEPAMLALLRASLGWLEDAHHAEFFRWKHRTNPFGPSPAWIALDGDRIVGLRVLLRWEFDSGERVARAVRAVDTATDPAYQGRGIFSRLTLQAVAELRDEGVHFVFNTPNAQSLPGYLKMGWQTVGRLAVSARPRSLATLVRMAGARAPAELWSTPSRSGIDACEVLADEAGLARLLASQPRPDGLRTRLTPEVVRWRYTGFPALGYRVLLRGTDVEDGFTVFRLRRRGRALEAVVGDVLVPGADVRAAAGLLASVPRAAGADYAIQLGDGVRLRAGYVPLPAQGPVLTWRAVTDSVCPPLPAWRLTLGDVELF
jgi:GNAT superfamily N-acetyltransferase